jgi:hypothetical protein
MPATKYKIWQWADPVGEGATQPIHVGISGVAKTAVEGDPFVVPNELLCNLLARAIMLPTPPGFVVDRDGVPYYVSLNFNLSGHELPDADCGLLAERHPELAWGIILFDVWVVNSDRHERAINFDTLADRVQVFDHDWAFMAGENGRARLERATDSTGIHLHCLAGEIAGLGGFREWFERINAVPEFYIREAVQAAAQVGLPEEDVEFCISFLLDRRTRLVELVRADSALFPRIPNSAWGALDS